MSDPEMPDGYMGPTFFPVRVVYPGAGDEGRPEKEYTALCFALPRVGDRVHGGGGRMLLVEQVIHDFLTDPAARIPHQFVTVVVGDEPDED